MRGVIVYLARDIPAFFMYCIYGESRSSLLIESTDSMLPSQELSSNKDISPVYTSVLEIALT